MSSGMQSVQGADQRAAGALAVLRVVHERPGVSRSEVARVLGMSTSSTTEITARLRARGLLTERAPEGARQRGRPSGLLQPHPAGPVVCAAEITHAGWRVAAVELGGTIVQVTEGRRARSAAVALREVRRGVEELSEEMGPRVRAIGVSIVGTVSERRLVQGATLRWGEVDLSALVPDDLRDLPFVAGSD